MWNYAFREAPGDVWTSGPLPDPVHVESIDELRTALDWAHIKHCLLRPYFEVKDYPLVESRELLPSFDSDLYEYKELPGFSMVVFERRLSPMSEIFQYDGLYSLHDGGDSETAAGACLLDCDISKRNMEVVLSRLPKRFHKDFINNFKESDLSAMECYHDLLAYLLQLERAHVIALDGSGAFHLAGIYGSLPSDLDSELKRFGMRIGKFKPGDNRLYELNRNFVYQYLMELSGFPIVSERRTSATMFARRLHRMGERFLVRVLGQSDRIITTISSPKQRRQYPRVEKMALVQVPEDQTETVEILHEQGFFIDTVKRVVILRVIYEQHRFNSKNVREDRALSIHRQEIIHPITGRVVDHFDILKQPRSMLLRLNDIVRGEHRGSVVYKRNERVEGTESHENRLKFLYSWLSKHQRRIIGYSDEFYSKIMQVLDSYLLAPDLAKVFLTMRNLHAEVYAKFSYIQQARMVNVLDELKDRRYKGRVVSYEEMLTLMSDILTGIKFEIINYNTKLGGMVVYVGKQVLGDGYLRRTYIEPPESALSNYGRGVRDLYDKLARLLDEMEALYQDVDSPVDPGTFSSF